jgi:hypothetical protein
LTRGRSDSPSGTSASNDSSFQRTTDGPKKIISVRRQTPSPHYARDVVARSWRWSCHRALLSAIVFHAMVPVAAVPAGDTCEGDGRTQARQGQGRGAASPQSVPRARRLGGVSMTTSFSTPVSSLPANESMVDGFVKSPSTVLRFIFRHCSVPLCMPHSSSEFILSLSKDAPPQAGFRKAQLVPPVAGELFAVYLGDFLRRHHG